MSASASVKGRVALLRAKVEVRATAAGVKVPRPPGPMKHGGSVIAFIEDPDGYKIELIERK